MIHPEVAVFLLALGQTSSHRLTADFSGTTVLCSVYTPTACHGSLVLICPYVLLPPWGQGRLYLESGGGPFTEVCLCPAPDPA